MDYQRNRFPQLNKKSEVDQFGLEIKMKKFQPINEINRRLNSIERKLEIMPFWKNFIFVFMIFSSLAIPAGIEFVLIRWYNELPSEFPLFFDPNEGSWQFLQKGWVIFIPLIYAGLNLILTNLTHSIFQFDRRLAQIIAISIGLFNILFLIAFSQLISIVLI